jgi:iduronate 2-sulfatase
VPPGVDPRVVFWECDAAPNTTGVSARVWGLPGAQGCVTSDDCVACLERYNATTPRSWVAAPCADACFVDGLVSSRVAADLAGKGAAARSGGAAPPPWALFAGFKRPHLGFAVPQWALDAQPADPPLAALRVPPPGFPPAGWSGNGEISSYPDAGREVLPNATFPNMLRDAAHGPLRRAYYAAVRWVDSQIGVVLDALDAAGLAESTWVVLTGDHGWSLGEHGSWAKVTLFETTARVPLIIAPPRGAKGWRTNATVGSDAFVEHLDVFPTLLDVLGVTEGIVPAGQLGGASLTPLMREGGAAAANFSAAFTQVMRGVEPGRKCNNNPGGGGGGGAPPCAMGVSIRVPGWRFTQWLGFDYGNGTGGAAGPIWGDLRGEELYDHRADDAGGGAADRNQNFDASELVDVAGDPLFAEVKQQLAAKLRAEWVQARSK